MKKALACAALLTAHQPVSIVAISPHVAFAPTAVTIRVRVNPNADNRRLIVEANSAAAYRRSDLPLEGDRAPMIHVVTWRGVEAGDYLVIVSVVSQGSKVLAQDRSRFLVVGNDEEGP